MTMPNERTRAVMQTREFLRDLLSAKATPKVPLAIRQRALRCLRHYPETYHLTRAATALPESWGDVE